MKNCSDCAGQADLDRERADAARWHGVAVDVLCLGLLIAFWIGFVGPVAVTEKRRSGDIFRDLAYARNVQAGQWLADPAYRGETIWYPPLSPLLVAGVSYVSGLTPGDCYRWSQVLVNWLIPAGMYWVVRGFWNRRAALGATLALLFAVPWWQTHVASGQPSWHAVILGWVALLLYRRVAERRSLGWALACGLFLAASFAHHPLVPAILTAAVAAQSLWSRWRARRLRVLRPDAPPPWSCDALVVGLPLIVGGAILVALQHGPTLNPAPREYLAPELGTLEFALMFANPWIWLMGLAGVIGAARHASLGARLLVAWLVVCAVGQVPGYLRLCCPAQAGGVPVLLPHQFQMLFQLGWAIAVGVGVDGTLAALARRLTWFSKYSGLRVALTLAALALTALPGAFRTSTNLRRYLRPVEYAPSLGRAADWIRRNTDINNVFIGEVDMAFAWLNAETGRKVWLTAPGHSNPRVPWDARAQLLARLEREPSPAAFWALARENGIDYCVASAGWAPRILRDPALLRQAVPRYLELVLDEPGVLAVFRVNPGASPPAATLNSAP